MRFRSIVQTKLALPIGILALVSAILMERFLPSTEGLNFIEGLLFGMSFGLIWATYWGFGNSKMK